MHIQHGMNARAYVPVSLQLGKVMSAAAEEPWERGLSYIAYHSSSPNGV
jgi:hypothetical protein